MVNEKRMIEEFKKLVSFDSESFHEFEIYKYLKGKLIGLGLDVFSDNASKKLNAPKAGNNIYAILTGNTNSKPILFSSHMDTVSPGKNKKVIIHNDGKVTSNGSTVLGADDITGLVAILEVLTVIKENNLSHPDIEIVFFIAEELYCKGSSVFDFTRVKSKCAYIFDLTGKVGTIANEAPSIIAIKANINGRGAHAGFEPEKGISAILIAAEAITNLRLGRVDEETTSNIGVINGGSVKNAVPEHVYLEGEIRSFSSEKAIELAKEFKEIFENAAKKFNGTVNFDFTEDIKAYRIDENSYVIERYRRALNELNYGEPKIVSTFGGSDNNNFNKHGITGIVISNAMNDVHTKNEYFYISELIKSAEIALKLATMEE